MDLNTLTDAELDALQLAVNTEIGSRLQKSRMMSRLADAMGSASAAGVPEEEIAVSFAEARTKAKIRYTEPVANIASTVADKTIATPAPRRSAWGLPANTIDNEATLGISGDNNGAS